MIIIDILNPENEQENKKEKQKKSLSKEEILKKLSQISFKIIPVGEIK